MEYDGASIEYSVAKSRKPTEAEVKAGIPANSTIVVEAIPHVVTFTHRGVPVYDVLLTDEQAAKMFADLPTPNA